MHNYDQHIMQVVWHAPWLTQPQSNPKHTIWTAQAVEAPRFSRV